MWAVKERRLGGFTKLTVTEPGVEGTWRLAFSLRENEGHSLGLLNSENLETPGLRADSSRLSGLWAPLPGKPGP